ncbi:hypothetical protein N5D37_04680 [Comamonas aquatica]|uniref:hypothetical protein n=1 Tax=Comamonas aquatica TaxID=225991 RepID=UPI00244C4A9F|nr:hypothetical protein [Comamonas aquatica]MDH1765003.1 hypothetical protein [Comamonas aquatica]
MPPAPRILLCASAAHCAQVLQAAAQARVPLHGLQPLTQWPTPAMPADSLLLWALLPAGATDAAQRLEAAWRAERLPHSPWPVHMLYGSAAQQAQQLRPWITTPAQGSAPHLQDDCQECLDAASEHQLFQHLLQR